MILGVEITKLKRTGAFPAFTAGIALASAFPMINMLARADVFTMQTGNPITILLNANWQMMSMLNMLAVILMSCIFYHTENIDRGTLKMAVLPVSPIKIFLSKGLIESMMILSAICLEMAAIGFCACYWFSLDGIKILSFFQLVGFQFITMMPSVLLSMMIAECCENIWMSLGINVLLVFVCSSFPQDSTVISLLPYNMPYQLWGDTNVWLTGAVALIQSLIFGTAAFLHKTRRSVRCAF